MARRLYSFAIGGIRMSPRTGTARRRSVMNRTYRMLREKGWLILAVLLLVGSVPAVPQAVRIAHGLTSLVIEAAPRLLRVVLELVLFS